MNGRFFSGRSFLALLEEFIISRNNVFMLTAPENYGIVPVAEKIPITEKELAGEAGEMRDIFAIE